MVSVVPQPKAGGSMATQAYACFKNPVVVEEIKADAGIDIGFTMIGKCSFFGISGWFLWLLKCLRGKSGLLDCYVRYG